MNWEEFRKKQREILARWREVRKELEPLEKECMGKEIKPGEKIPPTPKICTSGKYRELIEEEGKIRDKFLKLDEEYYKNQQK